MTKIANTLIELTVRNHPGVLSHITGLFARRAFNLEGIVCGPANGGAISRIYLLVNSRDRMDQMIKQLEKLYDVLEVSMKNDTGHSLFNKIENLLK